MPKHVVVDGSNIATEGRAMPSLKQLNEAVMAYIEDHPDDVVTVVVDATFGHRIDPREVPEFDAAVENNELVSPPAGAIGRGDAFLLTLPNKGGAAPSCPPSPTRQAPSSCRTTPSRSSTATIPGCSTRAAWWAASPYPTWGG